MAALIRIADRADAPLWMELFEAVVGRDYPARQVYDHTWVADQLAGGSGRTTWVAEERGSLVASISLLPGIAGTNNPVANLGRALFRPESFPDRAALRLVDQVIQAVAARRQIPILRVGATDSDLQEVVEHTGCRCVGFQPAKHMQVTQHGVLFYMHPQPAVAAARLPISCSLVQLGELAGRALKALGMEPPFRVEDGSTGYPLQSLDIFSETTAPQFEARAVDSLARHVPVEISTGSHRGQGLFRVDGAAPRGLLASRGTDVPGGLLWMYDDEDRCVRILAGFNTDDVTLGTLLRHLVQLAQERFNAVYVEIDVLSSAPRLLRTAEQIGFTPVAYFPALSHSHGHQVDVVKLVKLNIPYSRGGMGLTLEATAMVQKIEEFFEDQKTGVAIVALLRALAMFQGLGDGELRKIARLFQQKLYRAGETMFVQGGGGDEAFVVVRGEVEIAFDEPPQTVAVLGPGQLFGEQAFLDGSPRTATASATQPAIVLVIQRAAFYELIHREPHIGVVVMRNMAVELSAKLRRTNAALRRRQ